ncbi:MULTISPECIES: hypothetical protein [unclassified Meiothermus]|uniref:hypothetical protein n=1 Tax=unclassified Meiothermus TaxID=370471 RepID=UPI001F389DBC|nr:MULTISPECIES: hypothetical protein [unclassified Meiothermus]
MADTPRTVSYARILIKGREGYALLPSKADPRKRRWQKLPKADQSAGTTKPKGFGSLALPGWERRLPERLPFERFGNLSKGEMGRRGPVLLAEVEGSREGERWVLKPSNEGAAANEIIASVVGRSLGLNVPPAIVVEKEADLLAGSLYVPELRHVASFNVRNQLIFGPDGPEDIPNYWPQAALGKMLGDIDRKGGNWGVAPDGQRWDFDFSLSEGASKFVAPDTPDWNRQRLIDFREAIEWGRSKLSPSAFRRYLEPFQAIADTDPEKLYGWAGRVGDLGGLFLGKGPLGPSLIKAGHANRKAVQAALQEAR